MSTRALGIFLSLFAFLTASQPTLANEASKRPAQQKSAAQGKQASKPAPKKAAARKTTPTASKKKTAPSQARKTPAANARTAQASRPAAAPVPAVRSAGELAGLHLTPDPLSLKSNVALVVDQKTGEVLFEKNAEVALPIASLTKLMTAMIVIEAHQDLDEVIEITADDIDRLKNSSSRLRVGTRMTRAEALHLSLMSSENRAASALARHYPGGTPAFVAAMNARARSLGMRNTRFVESTGLSSENVASAHDLTRLAVAAYRHPLIRDYSTHPRHAIAAAGGHQLQYMNSNRLVDHPDWDIGLQKTGYISEAGRCLLMQARVDGRPVVMVFLDSRGKDSRLGDAARVRKWLETAEQTTMTTASARSS